MTDISYNDVYINHIKLDIPLIVNSSRIHYTARVGSYTLES